jgi:hypothetical protein
MPCCVATARYGPIFLFFGGASHLRGGRDAIPPSWQRQSFPSCHPDMGRANCPDD